MPLIQSAIKKMHKDKTRTARNQRRELQLRKTIQAARRSPNALNLSAAYSILDKAAKVHLIHPNKASRLKSKLSRQVVSAK